MFWIISLIAMKAAPATSYAPNPEESPLYPLLRVLPGNEQRRLGRQSVTRSDWIEECMKNTLISFFVLQGSCLPDSEVCVGHMCYVLLSCKPRHRKDRIFSPGDPALRSVSHIIVDEVHERSADNDILLCILKDLLAARKDLKLILLSATVDIRTYVDYFNCFHLDIEGRSFPVQRLFLEDIVDMTGYTLKEDSRCKLNERGDNHKKKKNLAREVSLHHLSSVTHAYRLWRLNNPIYAVAFLSRRSIVCTRKILRVAYISELSYSWKLDQI